MLRLCKETVGLKRSKSYQVYYHVTLKKPSAHGNITVCVCNKKKSDGKCVTTSVGQKAMLVLTEFHIKLVRITIFYFYVLYINNKMSSYILIALSSLKMGALLNTHTLQRDAMEMPFFEGGNAVNIHSWLVNILWKKFV